MLIERWKYGETNLKGNKSINRIERQYLQVNNVDANCRDIFLIGLKLGSQTFGTYMARDIIITYLIMVQFTVLFGIVAH